MADTSLVFNLLATDKASQVIGNVGDELGKADDALEDFKRTAADSGDGLGKFGEAADTADTRAMGFRDTLTGVQDTMAGVSMLAKGPSFEGFLTLGAGIGDLGSGIYNFIVPSLQAFKLQLVKAKIAAVALKVQSIAMRAATAAWAGVQWVLNAAMSANPIGLIVLAIAALVAIVIVAWKKSDTFRRIVTGAWNAIWNVVKKVGAWFKDTLWPWIKGVFEKIRGAIGKVVDWVKKNWPLLLGILTGPIGLAVVAIAKNWDKIKKGAKKVKDWVADKFNRLVEFFKGLPRKVTRAVSGLFDGMKSAFKGAVNWIIRKWNDLSLTIGGKHVSLPFGKSFDIPSVTLNTPNIPLLAKGGDIERAGLAVVGERGPEIVSLPRGARVSPLDNGNRKTTIELKLSGSASGLDRVFLSWLAKALRENPGVELVTG